jgi:ribosomal protein S19E (S16A)
MKEELTYYEQNKPLLKQKAIKYYKKNKIFIQTGIKKEKQPELYEWYIQDLSNAVFRIRHGEFHYKDL